MILLSLSRFEFTISSNLVNALGISANISLNSLMKGGNTKNIDIKNIIVNNRQTIDNDKGLDIFKIFLNLFVKLQIIFAMTSEHTISKRKFLKLQKIKKPKLNMINLYRRLLFNI